MHWEPPAWWAQQLRMQDLNCRAAWLTPRPPRRRSKTSLDVQCGALNQGFLTQLLFYPCFPGEEIEAQND